jgi:hypothetical protein
LQALPSSTVFLPPRKPGGRNFSCWPVRTPGGKPYFALGLNHIDPAPIDSKAERRTAYRGFSMMFFKFSLFLFMMARAGHRGSWFFGDRR